MDIKEIAQKIVDGGKVEELMKDLDDVKKVEVNKLVISLSKEVAANELEKAKALRAERNRVETQTKEISDEAVKTVKTQIRGEQIAKARSRFMTKMGLAEDKMKSVDDAFKTEDTGEHFDADLLEPIYSKAYAKANADVLIQAQKDKEILQKNALDFNSSSAAGGNAGGGSGADNNKQYAPEVLEMVRDAARQGIHMTPDEAERGMKGGKRVFAVKAKK